MSAVRHYLRNEGRTLASIWLLIRKRRDGGEVAVPYAGAQRPLLVVFFLVSLVEAAMFILVDLGVFATVLVHVVDLYALVLVAGFFAANVTRPHVASPDELRVRYGALFDLRVPIEYVRAVRRASKNHLGGGLINLGDDEFALALAFETNVLVELDRSVTVTRPLGKTGTARTLRFYADDPDSAVAAIAAASSASR